MENLDHFGALETRFASCGIEGNLWGCCGCTRHRRRSRVTPVGGPCCWCPHTVYKEAASSGPSMLPYLERTNCQLQIQLFDPW